MKDIKEFINESIYHMKDVKKVIEDELKTYSKEMIQKMENEIKDDIDEQDEFIEGNDESYIWQFMCNCAKALKTKPEDLWEDCGGSHLFSDAISNLK